MNIDSNKIVQVINALNNMRDNNTSSQGNENKKSSQSQNNKNQRGKSSKKGKELAKTSETALSNFNIYTSFIDLFKEVLVVVKDCEIEETKREQIRAERDKAIARIQAQKEIIMLYLERTFDERQYQFSEYFRIVDAAIEQQDTNTLALTLERIQHLAESNPFRALADYAQIQQMLAQDGTTFDV